MSDRSPEELVRGGSTETAPPQPRIRRAWYVACASKDLRDGPLRRDILDTPIVLFRGSSGSPAALLDRCPHRNIPLSMGQVIDGQLACGYHGWQFNEGGACTHVPALVGESTHPARRCPAFPTVEQQGWVWIWADPDTPPEGEPFRFRLAEDPRYLTLHRVLEAEASVHAVAENALDVPHTSFLHGGLFRVDADRNEITARISRHWDRVECEYIGEARPKGLAARILSPSGGLVTHFDRFYLPSVVEVEYQIGDENHILVNAALTPTRDHHTIVNAVVSIRARVPLWLIRPFAESAALKIFAQDQAVLLRQTESLRRFGDARFVSTELDLLGPHILRLMGQAAKGSLEEPTGTPYVKQIQMKV